MVTSMNNALFALLLGMMLGGNAWAADALDDPTRPAFELIPGLQSGTAAASAPTAASAGLQSVILSGRREAAIINGVEVEKGQKYGDAVLTVVNETCVVLMGPEGRQELHMFPGVGLSKTERACTGRRSLPRIRNTAGDIADNPQAVAKSRAHRVKKKRKAVVCADEPIKDGSGRK